MSPLPYYSKEATEGKIENYFSKQNFKLFLWVKKKVLQPLPAQLLPYPEQILHLKAKGESLFFNN